MTGIYANQRRHEQSGLIRTDQPLKVLSSGYASMSCIMYLGCNTDGSGYLPGIEKK